MEAMAVSFLLFLARPGIYVFFQTAIRQLPSSHNSAIRTAFVPPGSYDLYTTFSAGFELSGWSRTAAKAGLF
jgi:hypothetical protein